MHLTGSCFLDSNTASTSSGRAYSAIAGGGHVKMTLSALIVPGTRAGAALWWPASKPTFPNKVLLRGGGAPTSLVHGLASASSGGSIYCATSLSSAAAAGVTSQGEECLESFPPGDAPVCYGNGIHLGPGTCVNHSISQGPGGSGGAIDVMMCTVTLGNATIAESTSGGSGGGGALHLGPASMLVARSGTTFVANYAGSGGSGGAIACDRCHSIRLASGTSLLSNTADRSGGAISIVNPLDPTTTSSGSIFRDNTARTGDGGAVHVVHNGVDGASGYWNSTGDMFESNIAEQGSGGALAAEGTLVTLESGVPGEVQVSGSGTPPVATVPSLCRSNSAPHGGGGCVFWEPLATSTGSTSWTSLSPKISATSASGSGSNTSFQTVASNFAGYGNQLASGPFTLSISNTSGSPRIAAPSGGGSLQPRPHVELLDVYGNVMVGPRAAAVTVDGVIKDAPSADVTIFGGLSRAVAAASGNATFDSLGLRSRPGSGPHRISFAAKVSIGDVVREVVSAQPLEAWVEPCDGNTFADGAACVRCPSNSRRVSARGPAQSACACSENHYAVNIDSVFSCLPCPLNSRRVSAWGPAQSACACSENHYAVNIDSVFSCLPCPLNSRRVSARGPAQNACACSKNYYATVTAAGMACTPCPARSRSAPGARNASACWCERGFFRQRMNCKDCSRHAFCPPNCTAPVTARGYWKVPWREESAPDARLECLRRAACLGPTPDDANATEGCAPLHLGPLCAPRARAPPTGPPARTTAWRAATARPRA